MNEVDEPTTKEDDIENFDHEDISDFSKVVETLLNDEHMQLKTILNNRQVTKLTTLQVLSQIYDIVFLKTWIEDYCRLRVSGDGGKGRNDIVKIASSHYSYRDKDDDNVLDRLRRR